jgi:Rrf2 family transcriptional regulator, iron-sulfur cluster assembly transcription factor
VVLVAEGTSRRGYTEHAELCVRSQTCPTRMIWQEAAQAMFDRLKAITLADILGLAGCGKSQEPNEVFTPKRKTTQ